MFGDLTVKVKMEPSKRYKQYLKSHMLLIIVFLLMLPYAVRLIDRVKETFIMKASYLHLSIIRPDFLWNYSIFYK